MSVYAVFPSCNVDRAKLAVDKWCGMGYLTMVLTDAGVLSLDATCEIGATHLVHVEEYEGYWKSCNLLCRKVLEHDRKTKVVVVAADDIFPDPKYSADIIRDEFLERFPDTFGVMQPTGDITHMRGTDKICGSPWIGRKVIERLYGGNGPFHPGYFQFYGDEELHEVAKHVGILQQRMDLTQKHLHWCRRGNERPKKTDYQIRNSSQWWEKDKATFQARKEEGFPGHEAIAPKMEDDLDKFLR